MLKICARAPRASAAASCARWFASRVQSHDELVGSVLLGSSQNDSIAYQAGKFGDGRHATGAAPQPGTTTGGSLLRDDPPTL